MDLQNFLEKIRFYYSDDEDKIAMIAYYYYKTENKIKFSALEMDEWFKPLHVEPPSFTTISKILRDSEKFISCYASVSYKLEGKVIMSFKKYDKHLSTKGEDSIIDDDIIPESLYKSTRGFIEKLAEQINASYQYEIYDGCAVLMRRLFEILLILSYTEKRIDSEIKDPRSGNYQMLEKIVANAKGNATLNLSRNSKECLDLFRDLGNYAAHKIHYNTCKKDIEQNRLKYRALIEDLLYLSAIKK